MEEGITERNYYLKEKYSRWLKKAVLLFIMTIFMIPVILVHGTKQTVSAAQDEGMMKGKDGYFYINIEGADGAVTKQRIDVEFSKGEEPLGHQEKQNVTVSQPDKGKNNPHNLTVIIDEKNYKETLSGSTTIENKAAGYLNGVGIIPGTPYIEKELADGSKQKVYEETAYTVFVVKCTYEKEAYTYETTSVSGNDPSTRFNAREYNWENNGKSTLSKKVYTSKKKETFYLQINMSQTGAFYPAGVTSPYHATYTLSLRHPKLTIVYDGNGATSGTTKNQTVNYNSSANLYNFSTFGLEKSGHRRLAGAEWNTKKDGSGTSYAQTAEHTAAQYVPIADGSDAEDVKSQTLKLYAQWEAARTVTLNKGTGIVSVSGAGQYYPGDSVTINASLSDGYTWKAWTGTSANTNAISSGSNGTITTKKITFTMPDRNITLKAGGVLDGWTSFEARLYANPPSGVDITSWYVNSTWTLDGQAAASTGGRYDAAAVAASPGKYIHKTYKKGNLYTVPQSHNIKIDGYTVVTGGGTKNGWWTADGTYVNIDGDANGKVEADSLYQHVDADGILRLYANWQPTTASYTVRHWTQKISGNAGIQDSANYDLADTETLTGAAGAAVTPAVKTYTGFTSPVAKSGVITADGTLTIDYYYTRGTYTYTVRHWRQKLTGNASVHDSTNYDLADTEQGRAQYGATVTPAVKTYPGYTSPAAKSAVVTADSTLVVDYYYARATYTYKVRHWKQKVSGDATKHDSTNYDLADTETGTGIYGATVTPAVKTYTGFNSPARQTSVIPAGNSLTVDYYYTRRFYAVHLTPGIGIDPATVTGGGSYMYGASVTISASTITGYHWLHWGGTYNTTEQTYTFTMPAQNVSMTANGEANWYTIHFNPNDGVELVRMEDILTQYDTDITLPDIILADGTPAYERKCCYVDKNGDEKEYNSVFKGWGTEPNRGLYTPEYTAGETVRNLTAENNGAVTLYAIWDDCPWIVAEDLYYTLTQAQSGFITEMEILSHATASDREDGSPIAPGFHDDGTSFSIPDYSERDFTQFQHSGSVTENLTVIDSSGSKYYKQITVHIVDTTPVKVKPIGTTRFINEKYYYMDYEYGGLEDNSIWKTDPEYVACITDAFRRLREDDPEQVYYFSHETILEMKEFVQTYGVGNSKTPGALTEFYNRFMAPNRIK